MTNRFRRLLIRLGKVLPFLLCFVVLISYVESAIALYTEDYMLYEGHITLNTPISFWLAQRFEYDLLTIFAATILSVAVETCWWNRSAIAFLALHLLLCRCIESVELYPSYIYSICLANIIICGTLCYKGIKLAIK